MGTQASSDLSFDVERTRTPLLIAEDDVPLANLLRKVLQAESYSVEVAHSGDLAYDAISRSRYQIVILDLNLPKIDGLTLLQEVRKIRPHLSVLVLTGSSKLEDRIRSLDSGADDCLLKPFSFFELTARLRAILRRNHSAPVETLRICDLEVDPVALSCKRAGSPIDLTSTEFKLLEYLMKNKGRPLSRAILMERVWNLPYDSSSNLVDVYIKYLRDKVDSSYATKLIRTVRGVGYSISEQ